MNKPNFFIVGAPKAGTTSVHQYLSEHPDICMSNPKEINYFSSDEIRQQSLYYKDYIARELEEYQSAFSDSVCCKAVGDASVSYLFYPNVADKIKSYNEDAKVVIFLRNPVQRGFSHYLMDERLGLVKCSYESIVNRVCHHKNADLYYQQYVELGLYYKQVRRYLDVFGEGSVKLYLLEDIIEDLPGLMADLFSFLEVDSEFNPGLDKLYNDYSAPNNIIMKWLYKRHILRKLAKNILPHKVIALIKSRFNKKDKKPELSLGLKNKLLNIYDEDIRMLEELINRDLNDWRK